MWVWVMCVCVGGGGGEGRGEGALRGGGSELWFGNAVVQCGLDGGPRVAHGRWCAFCVAVNCALSSLFGHVAWAGVGSRDEFSVGR